MERYNEYKDSGVQWLGEIPSHWDMQRWRFLLTENKVKNTDCKVKVQLQFKYGDIVRKANQDEDAGVLETISKYTVVAPDDIMINGLNLNYDFISQRVAQVRENGVITSAYVSLRPTSLACSRYYTYFLKSMDFKKMFHGMGTGIRLTLSYNELKNQFIPFPSIAEQQAIADYLDTATAKIDEAIAQQQKMIDLLNERKQIIINNAVTKGLNPDAPMKDSGVDWIGEIPEHWEVSRIKNVITLLTDYDANGSFSDIAKNCNINNGTPYAWMVRTTDLVNNRVGIVEGNNYCDKKTYDYLAKSSLESGDLLMTKRGNVGMVYVVPECSCPMTLAPNLYLLKTKASDINNRYLMHYLSSTKPKSQLAILNKSTTLGALYKDDVKSLQIVLPPIDEQLLLAQFIDKELDKVDSVISNCNRQISLLQERKQIIINDVVTGKVKVS